MILYLSLAGSGTSDTLEIALIAAVEAETTLRYLAVVDDDQFGDVDGATMTMVAEELRFLLRAHLVAVQRRLTASPEASVVIVRGSAMDAVGSTDAIITEVLIGGPLTLDPDAERELVAELARRSGTAVRVLG